MRQPDRAAGCDGAVPGHGVPATASPHSSVPPPLREFRPTLENGPFKRLILAFMVGSTALAIIRPLYLFFFTFVLDAEEKAIYTLAAFYLANFIWGYLITEARHAEMRSQLAARVADGAADTRTEHPPTAVRAHGTQ